MLGNVGDSRAVLGTRDEDGSLVAVQLTVDLKPNIPGNLHFPPPSILEITHSCVTNLASGSQRQNQLSLEDRPLQSWNCGPKDVNSLTE